MVIGFILFFVAGLAFGFAAPGRMAYVALVFPVFFAALDAVAHGIDAFLLLMLILASAITVAGIFGGRMLAARMDERPGTAL